MILGIELGSTRIKAVGLDRTFTPVASGEHMWKSTYSNGIWTYDLAEVQKGVQSALSGIKSRESITCMGVSGMMHGYLAFDSEWNLLVPFRTWQNMTTSEASKILTEQFHFRIPQRWSIAHLYQAVLNKEPHVERIAHITTLAGYVHYMLTGVNVLGLGEASGMFPIDSETGTYDEAMLQKFENLTSEQPWNIRDLLPKIRRADENAGKLTPFGAQWLDGLLPTGLSFAPPEGDAGTGMVATNAVAPRTGNVSAGTSIFSMVVLEKQLSRVYPEIDIVATPTGKPVAMVHCNNGTNDMNTWVNILKETVELFGGCIDADLFYTKLYRHSLNGEPDCGGILTCNYMAGEEVTHFEEGRPLILRSQGSKFNLANFLRSQLYTAMSTMMIGMDILAGECVTIDSITGHGGLFKTPGVGQKYLAAACNTPVTVMQTAGEGGPYGMALLAAYCDSQTDETLESFLAKKVFKNTLSSTVAPDPSDVVGFRDYLSKFKRGLAVEAAAVLAI